MKIESANKLKSYLLKCMADELRKVEDCWFKENLMFIFGPGFILLKFPVGPITEEVGFSHTFSTIFWIRELISRLSWGFVPF